jgi:hypothetical protein
MVAPPEWIEENEFKGWDIWAEFIDVWLNRFGNDGWELVGPYTAHGWQVGATFKRPRD